MVSMGRAAYILPIIHALRFYQMYIPIRRGKHRLAKLINGLAKYLPKGTNIEIESKDGMKFKVDPMERQYQQLFFFRTYDPYETQVIKQIINEGDMVFDIGANFGWYTLLLSYVTGNSGAVHSFEPVPWIFDRLKTNCELNNLKTNIFLNNFALGKTEGIVPIHVFRNRACGDASISTLGLEDFDTFQCPTKTLDSYLSDCGIHKVNFIKCDIEGAEMSVLEGSKLVLSSATPPMWLLELNKFTCNAFGYEPIDLLIFLQEASNYIFYHLDEARPGKLRRMLRLDEYRNLENVLCIVPELHAQRIQNLLIR